MACRSTEDAEHRWYTTKRRVDEDITFCWECGQGWTPDNGLLTDAELEWLEPVQWMEAENLRWLDHLALSGQDSNLQQTD